MHGSAEVAVEVPGGEGTDLRLVFEAMVDLVSFHQIVFDDAQRPVDYRLLDCNPAFCSALGTTRERCLGMLASDLFGALPPPDLAIYARVAATGVPARFTSAPAALGRQYAISAVSPVRGTFAVIATDLTERLAAAAALEASEERFRRAVREAPFPVMIHADDGQVLALSRGWEAASGYTLSDIPTTSDWTRKAYREKRERMQGTIEALYELDRSVDEGEWELVSRGGEKRIWDFSSAPLGRQADGRRLVISMAKDVTRRHRAEEATAAERERLAVTLRSIGDAVIATDQVGHVAVFNRVAEELTGWKAGEAMGKPLAEVFPLVDRRARKPVPDPAARVLASGQPDVPATALLQPKAGPERVVASSCSPIRNQESRTVGAVLVFRDVTEEERRDEALARTQRLESLAALGGGIAHEFNNLLTAILGNLGLAGEEGIDDSVRELLKEAESAAWRARGLTQQLLTFAKGGAPVRKVTWLGEPLREASQLATQGTGCVAQLTVDPLLWPAEVDAEQLAQVIRALVRNGVEAMGGSGTLHVRADNVTLAADNGQALPPGPYVRVQVEDEGPGIPEEVAAHIFDPFFSTKPQSSGLGLSVCHSIVGRHGGRIELVQHPGPGARLDVYLPAAPTAATRPAGKAAPQGALDAHVLLMDDEEMLRRTAARLLKALGCTVVTAADGREALAHYKRASAEGLPFDLVVVDMTVPGGMGGLETCRHLKELDPAAVVVVSSGYSGSPVMADHAAHGFAAVLPKPYGATELREVLTRVLAEARAVS